MAQNSIPGSIREAAANSARNACTSAEKTNVLAIPSNAQHLSQRPDQDLEFLSQGTVFVSQLNEMSLRGGSWCSELPTASRPGLISASEQFHVLKHQKAQVPDEVQRGSPRRERRKTRVKTPKTKHSFTVCPKATWSSLKYALDASSQYAWIPRTTVCADVGQEDVGRVMKKHARQAHMTRTQKSPINCPSNTSSAKGMVFKPACLKNSTQFSYR
ncbi:hypothetical protein ACRRTK_007577 [Alexandromys fortis]